MELLDGQAAAFTAADHAAVQDLVLHLLHDFEGTAPLAHALLADAFFPQAPVRVNFGG